MSVNMESIMKKVNAYAELPRGQREAKRAVLDQVKHGSAKMPSGAEIFDRDRIERAAVRLIHCINEAAREHAKDVYGGDGVPNSVLNIIEELDYVTPTLVGDHYELPLYFGGPLRRDSLRTTSLDGNYGWYTGGGIDNIVALFNNGYDAENYAYGIWEGHGDDRIRSKISRPALRFIQQGVEDFMGNYGSEFNVSVKIASVYKE